jgi:hypothetical protein
VDIKEFWRQYDIADKEHKKWEKRADKVLKRYRLESENGDGTVSPSFNVLWANTSVQEPDLFSQVPKPDIARRYKDDDPVGAHGSKVLERSLEFVMDDGDFHTFGKRSVRDYQLPGRTSCKIRYCPTYSTVRRSVELEARGTLGPNGETDSLQFFKDDEEVDREQVQYQNGVAFMDEDVEEVVDEHVIIERWPWKNFRHQKAKRWEDVGWVDYISYLDRDQLKKLLGNKAKNIELTVDSAGDEKREGNSFNPTHAEVHEVWIARTRKVAIAIKGIDDKWLKEGEDPLRLDKFFPCPAPLMAVDTNDSLQPIPLFTLYQHQANELDLITKRISVLMRALKLAGFYAGSEKETLKKLFEADDNTMIPVADWASLKASGGVSGLIEWLPVEEVGKVLTALFREREAIVAQIFELTGVADIQRGATDPRETKGAQAIKANYASRRTLVPKQDIERYFRDVLRIAAEIMAEHFSVDTLERMTGLPVPPEVHAMLQDELQRQYRIDIETDSTVAPDQEREQANMAAALEAVTAFIQAMGPMIQQGLPIELALQLLKTYLRKFKWGREVEETIEQLERNPPQPQPDPEEKKIQMEMQIEQQKAQLDQQKSMMEMQMKQKELEMKLQEMMMKLQFEQAKSEQELQIEAVKGQAEMQIAQQGVAQDQQMHDQQMQQNEQSHQQTMRQQKEKSSAQNVSVRQGSQGANSAR